MSTLFSLTYQENPAGEFVLKERHETSGGRSQSPAACSREIIMSLMQKNGKKRGINDALRHAK